ncbi:MAG TPA: hypothetical protein VFB79_16785 [Candidatus Angelobacter sp.]|nr:hypothetical protein [Candidatus Angelobacter sp.]
MTATLLQWSLELRLPEGDVNRQKENAFARLKKNKKKIKVSKD